VILIVFAAVLFFTDNLLAAVVFVIAGIIMFFVAEAPKRKFKKLFKEKVVSQLAKQIDSSIEYQPTGGWSYSFLYDIGLLNTQPNQGRSEDSFSGRMGATDIKFCELLAEKKTTHVDSNGKTRTTVEQLFKGLVLEADFHKSFKGETVILPDWAERSSWKWLAKKFQAKSRDGNRIVALENPEFEKLFAVYGSDQVEARYLLSPSMMQRMVDLYHKLSASASCKISILFKSEKMYLAVDWNHNFFEYDFRKSVAEEVKETYEELKLCTGIVEDLNLNTRIWGKE
jgi:hypothetical protein